MILKIRECLCSSLRYSSIAWRTRNFFGSIKNLIYWFKIIWNDRDWDWTFIYIILEHKLRAVAANERDFGVHTTSGRDARDITLAAALCKRIINDDYVEPAIGPWMKRIKIRRIEKGKAPYFYDFYMIEQDSRLLFKILDEKSRGWWN
jgi:hypothetical protein